MSFFDLSHNPFFKTISTIVIGAIAPLGVAAIDHPTGGLGAALTANPVYAAVWATITLTAHNLWSQWQSQNPSGAQIAAVQVAPTATTDAMANYHTYQP